MDRADEDGMGRPFGVGDDIEQVVHAVAEIDVGDAAALKHHFGALCAPSAKGVAGPIGDAGVGFGFDDDPAGEVAID